MSGKSGYILCGVIPALEYHYLNGNYIKEERKYRKVVQQVLVALEFESGKLVKNSFALVGREERGKRHL